MLIFLLHHYSCSCIKLTEENKNPIKAEIVYELYHSFSISLLFVSVS